MRAKEGVNELAGGKAYSPPGGFAQRKRGRSTRGTKQNTRSTKMDSVTQLLVLLVSLLCFLCSVPVPLCKAPNHQSPRPKRVAPIRVIARRRLRDHLRTGRSKELSFMKSGDFQRSREVQHRRPSNWGIIYEIHRSGPQECPLL